MYSLAELDRAPSETWSSDTLSQAKMIQNCIEMRTVAWNQPREVVKSWKVMESTTKCETH